MTCVTASFAKVDQRVWFCVRSDFQFHECTKVFGDRVFRLIGYARVGLLGLEVIPVIKRLILIVCWSPTLNLFVGSLHPCVEQSVIDGLIVDFVFYSFFYIASSHMGLDVITDDD